MSGIVKIELRLLEASLVTRNTETKIQQKKKEKKKKKKRGEVMMLP